jgi:uncharacterized coiled-coil DUF342 family protein
MRNEWLEPYMQRLILLQRRCSAPTQRLREEALTPAERDALRAELREIAEEAQSLKMEYRAILNHLKTKNPAGPTSGAS